MINQELLRNQRNLRPKTQLSESATPVMRRLLRAFRRREENAFGEIKKTDGFILHPRVLELQDRFLQWCGTDDADNCWREGLTADDQRRCAWVLLALRNDMLTASRMVHLYWAYAMFPAEETPDRRADTLSVAVEIHLPGNTRNTGGQINVRSEAEFSPIMPQTVADVVFMVSAHCQAHVDRFLHHGLESRSADTTVDCLSGD